MTEQQYRVIADRDEGDDPQNWDRVEAGDRVVVTHSDGEFWPVRIERPVPTTGLPAPMALTAAEQDSYTAAMAEPSLPTREQIAGVVHEVVENGSWTDSDDMQPLIADAVLALLQKGADR